MQTPQVTTTNSFAATYYGYWGKAVRSEQDKSFAYHLLPYHCLDVAAVGQVLLKRHPRIRRLVSEAISRDDSLLDGWASFILALHDLGKFAEAFQNLRPDIFRTLRGYESNKPYPVRHDSLGCAVWEEKTWDLVWAENWLRLPEDTRTPAAKREWARIALSWMRAMTGHHGQPPMVIGANGFRLSSSPHFTQYDLKAAADFVKTVAHLLLPQARAPMAVDQLASAHREKSWVLAGFAVLCDWIGSDTAYFQYVNNAMPLEDYWRRYALPRAENAIRAAGVLPSTVSATGGMSVLFPGIQTPSPLQAYAETCEIADGPQLFLLEDLTGSGKTEAALVLAHRLMQQRAAEGLFIALPTMATANAMYDRLAEAYKRLFDEKAAPSLVLAHGARHLSDKFRHTVMPMASIDMDYGEKEDTATVQCAAWLADNRKKALLADIGVGTVDQVLMAVLPSKHQSLRLLGLANRVLIVDEVHAYDPYMRTLLETVLRFHAAHGGSAILLSATLPHAMRKQLAKGFASGLKVSSTELTNFNFPLTTHISQAGTMETPVAHRPDAARSMRVELIHSAEEAEDIIVKAIHTGKCACWIRNTVFDATESYKKLQSQLGDESVELFHARFAMGDRLDIESRVQARFGKYSKQEERRGKLLIATQVVEQSLDLDFDVMVSDLAPIDLIIQRAGRLQRHRRDAAGNPIEEQSGGDERSAPVLYVLSPAVNEDPRADWYSAMLPKSARVYPSHGQLWLTAELLKDRGGWRMPDDARSLIENVFGEEAQERIPPALAEKDRRADGEARANASLGRSNCLKLEDGYEATVMSNWWADTATPTRLGEVTTTVRLARWDGVALHPWYSAERSPWDLSQLSVRQTWIAGEASFDPSLTKAIDALKVTLPDKGKWSVLVPLIVDENGGSGWAVNKEGDPIRVRYCPRLGLVVSKECSDE